MPEPLTSQEKQFIQLLIQHAGPDRQVRYAVLRKAGVPERVAQIYNSNAEVLDTLVSRKLQILRDKKWIEMHNTSLYTILHEP